MQFGSSYEDLGPFSQATAGAKVPSGASGRSGGRWTTIHVAQHSPEPPTDGYSALMMPVVPAATPALPVTPKRTGPRVSEYRSL